MQRSGFVLVVMAACGGGGDGSIDAVPPDAPVDAAADGDADGDPSAVNAPPLDPDLPTSLFDATSFLYTGDDPVQTGVTVGAIDPTRVAVIRGRVLDRSGAAITGVAITILDHPELGQTLSRADGRFDLAVNGGGISTVRYDSAAHLLVQRQVAVPVLDYVHAPDVVLVGRDPEVTSITMGSASIQVARGSPQTDDDGTRQATVLFPPGVAAAIVQPDGSTVPAATLDVRLTEYTVGDSGPVAMPGTLPATSAYTYAVELGTDQSIAKVDGKDIVFDRPVYLYVENFLDLPVGEVVPVGYYDPARSAWIGSANGRIIELLTAAGDVDVDGDGAADTGAALANLGITDDERARIAALYAPGQTLWRTPTEHFSTFDCNWSVVCDGSCTPPKEPPPPTPSPCQSNRSGSIIGCERQTLGEDVDVAGTPFTLHYQSDRVPGRTAENRVAISLATAGAPSGVQGTELEVLVAGQKLTQSAPATTPGAVVTWDGKDAYGREVVGSQRFTVRVGYRYKVRYARGPQVAISWAAVSGIPMSGDYARMELTLYQEWHGTFRRWNNGAQRLGGWSLSAVHGYDPIGRVLHLGDGTQRDTESLGAVTIATIAGSIAGLAGDGGPAVDARLSGPTGVAIAPDGALYVADSGNYRVRRIGTDGVIATIAGTTFGNSGDGGPATLAQFNQVTDVAVGPDGSVYIADALAHRVRRVGVDGVIRPFAGNGSIAFSGDGGPATAAGIEPYGIAVGRDGAVYIADRQASRVRVVDQTGTIQTFAGTATAGYAGDGGPAATARLSGPSGVAIGPDGSVFIMDRSNHRVRRVTPQGIIDTVAGNGTYGGGGDGAAATSAQLASPSRVTVGPDGTLYIADAGNNRIRAVGGEGVISTIAGTGASGFAGDGGLAPGAALSGPVALAATPDGTLHVSDFYNHRIRRLRAALPGGTGAEIFVPALDAMEVYVFSNAGRHLRTLDGLTGAVRAAFAYDVHGLATIDDGDGNVTVVERDAAGAPAAIVSPDGYRTELAIDSHGFVAAIDDPSGAAITLGYTPTGLLTSLVDRRGGVHAFAYDSLGRLVEDTDPGGGTQTLTRTTTATATTVTVTTGLGRATTYRIERLASGAEQSTITDPGGASTTTVRGTDGVTTLTAPDGTVDVVTPGPDPRFGMFAPIAASHTRTTPGGRTRVATVTRTATMNPSGDPLDVATLTTTATVAGNTTTQHYVGATRTLTTTSPEGRVETMTLDARGRVASTDGGGRGPYAYHRDARGRLIRIEAGTGAAPRTTELAYGTNGKLANTTDAVGGVTTLAYDANGRLTEITTPDGTTSTRTTRFGYDASDNLTDLRTPSGALHAFAYDAMDLGASYAPPVVTAGGVPTTLVRNQDRQLTHVGLADGSGADLIFDASGRPTGLSVATGVVGYGYDASDRVVSITAPGGVAESFTYDGGLMLASTLVGPVAGTVTRAYDASLRPSSVAVNALAPTTWSYDTDDLVVGAGAMTMARDPDDGLITGTSLGVASTAWTYNELGEPSTFRALVGGAPRLELAFARDGLGRVTQRIETIGGTTTTYAYTYDPAGRLIRVQANGVELEAYVYDANNNRVSASVGGVVRAAVFDARDRQTSDGATTFQHAPTGERTARTTAAGTTTYTYDALGNLLGVAAPASATIAYVVDGQGRRVGKRVGGTLVQGFLYLGGLRPIAELDGTGAVVSRFVYAERDNVPDYMIRSGTSYRIVTDDVGSPRLVVNASTGAIAQRIDYDGFGNVTADTNPGFQPFGYAGGLYDPATGLVRFGARDYDAVTGRWMARDPILFDAGDTNLYAYGFGDPINHRDPSGLDPPANLLPREVPRDLGLKPPPEFKPPPARPAACTPKTLGEKIKSGVKDVADFLDAPLADEVKLVRGKGENFLRKQDKTLPSKFDKHVEDARGANKDMKMTSLPPFSMSF